MSAASDQHKAVLPPDVLQDSKRAVRRLAERCLQPNGFGSFSISIYDTAWLAMIRDPVDPNGWLFPESYSYLLLHQAQDGMWPTYASPIDGILNTLAGLLALIKHCKADAIGIDSPRPLKAWDIPERVEAARRALQSALNNWDVNQTLHVGFEMLVPGLLRQLAEEGVVFDFDGQAALTALYQKKLARLHPDMLASTQQTTLLHSLEALAGVFDFGRLRHHCSAYSGMLGSPASTAAYLLHAPEWDVRAQSYLENVVRSYGSCGGVPSGFPTPVFEISWTMSTLLANGFSVEDFPKDDLRVVTDYLQKAIDEQGGVLGFAPTLLPDADDTAVSLLAMTSLGVHVDRAPLIWSFESSNRFKTYRLERTPSVSANCNVLVALLTSPDDVDLYVPQIEKAVRFLCGSWNADHLQDKWNLAAEYTYMLLASALYRLLSVYAGGSLRCLAAELIKIDVPIVLVQLLSRAIFRQQHNGSWGDSIERTSYATLLLSYALKLPWPLAIRQHAEAALFKAKTYLAAHYDQRANGDYLWIEKVTYRLPTLAEAYYLAALNSSPKEHPWTLEIEQIFFKTDNTKTKKMAQFFSRLPLLRGLSAAPMALAVHEAAVYASRLEGVRLDIFLRDDMPMSTDKYLAYIPIAWTTINAANGYALSGDEMWEMMVISMLNYQVDEYMESVVAYLDDENSQALATIIGAEIRSREPGLAVHSSLHPTSSFDATVPSPPASDCSSSDSSPSLTDVAEVLSKYIKHIKQSPILLQSPETAQLRVLQELEKFLLAHMAHNADNNNNNNNSRRRNQEHHHHHRPGGQASPIDWHNQIPYYDWVRTTGANDTSCPYSFAFFCCLISPSGSHCLASMEQRYLARELCLHLATLCRQYNDYGSAVRDDAEGNLNSLHFPEFAIGGDGQSLEEAKGVLMRVAELERAMMQVCWEALSASLDAGIRGKMKAFIDVTDLFGQIYVARDIASRMQR
ncbi:Ent-kaurene synthase [Trichoderma reesei RUT C-30]|uniref:Ent-kaurene synthase n=1 Tax=Hypocrea jecorina (strain ATCC 56765 / BCRC 32924 / NRRL 11460 / Rut C-30) TaxID=1344414 RepID=A0A024SGY2_HYPJR|nr:Ent-kaurene synthase [Trichoderma reesei RUT C-30]